MQYTSDTYGMNRLNPEVKTQWLTALRSGDYTQAMGVLKQGHAAGPTSHCCLGVLSELAPQSLGEFVFTSGFGWNYIATDGQHEGSVCPASVKRWANLETSTGYTIIGVDPDGGRVGENLASLNDARFTFEQIADIIEYAL